MGFLSVFWTKYILQFGCKWPQPLRSWLQPISIYPLGVMLLNTLPAVALGYLLGIVGILPKHPCLSKQYPLWVKQQRKCVLSSLAGIVDYSHMDKIGYLVTFKRLPHSMFCFALCTCFSVDFLYYLCFSECQSQLRFQQQWSLPISPLHRRLV